jgi:hypothetical protein
MADVTLDQEITEQAQHVVESSVMVSRLQGLSNDVCLAQLKRNGMQFASNVRCIHPEDLDASDVGTPPSPR